MKRVLALVITASIAFGNASFVQATPLDAAQKENAESQLKKSEAELESSDDKLDELESAIEKLDNQIEMLMADLEESKRSIAKSEADINSAKKSVLDAEADMKEQQELFNNRMRAVYKNGSSGYLSIVLKSENFSDLVSNTENVYRMINFDKKVADELSIKRKTLFEKQKYLEEENQKLINLKLEKESKLTELNTSKDEEKKLIDEAKRQQSLLAEKVKKDQASVNDAISSLDDQAISIATSDSSSTDDITVAIKYLENRSKVAKSSKLSDAIARGKAIISARTKATSNTAQADRGVTVSRVNSNVNTSNTNTTAGKASGAAIALYAQQFLGDPYLWGGTRPYSQGDPGSGFDCSGLVQYCYKKFGISITRTCETQIKYDGKFVDKDSLIAGDLIYFGTWDNPHHVGMYIGNGCYIHAPRTGDVVKISSLSARKDFLAAKRILN